MAFLLSNSGDDALTKFDFNQMLYKKTAAWSFDNIKNSSVDTLYFCSSNDVYINKAKENGFEISDMSVFKNADSPEYDKVLLSFANMPLLSSDTINQAIKHFENSEKDIIVITGSQKRTNLDIGCAYLFSAKTFCELIQCEEDIYTFENHIKNNNIDAGFFIVRDKECTSISDIRTFSKVSETARYETIYQFMENGVNFPAFESVIITPDVKIGKNTTILPGTILKGNTVIGENCIIGPNSYLEDSSVGDNTNFKASFASESEIGSNCTIGPFSNLRPNSKLADRVKVGDFVEIKNSTIGEKTSVAHLTYIGDSDIGSKVNFGCGTVTVNYDGVNKFRTKVGDNVFIGCNTNLISPVVVEDNAYIAAGSTITDDIPEYTLAIARARQINKKDWVKDKDFKK